MPNPPTTPDITARLASILHDLWRAEATRAGWQHGELYDPERKLHDALIPYDELPEEDRAQLLMAIECEEFEQKLSRVLCPNLFRWYVRGPTRPFARGELRVGTRVRYLHEPDTEGRVESWKPGPDGRPESVTVRWADGETASYANQEQCLVRVGEAR